MVAGGGHESCIIIDGRDHWNALRLCGGIRRMLLHVSDKASSDPIFVQSIPLSSQTAINDRSLSWEWVRRLCALTGFILHTYRFKSIVHLISTLGRTAYNNQK